MWPGVKAKNVWLSVSVPLLVCMLLPEYVPLAEVADEAKYLLFPFFQPERNPVSKPQLTTMFPVTKEQSVIVPALARGRVITRPKARMAKETIWGENICFFIGFNLDRDQSPGLRARVAIEATSLNTYLACHKGVAGFFKFNRRSFFDSMRPGPGHVGSPLSAS